MSDFACSSCGAELSGALYEAEVTCGYCRTSQPNRHCLPPDSEVLVTGLRGLTLKRIVACEGPQRILLGDSVVRLSEVIPVKPVTGELDAGVQVFCRHLSLWEQTWTASASRAGQVRVKHRNHAFQSSFFDRVVSLTQVRLPAREQDQHRRGRLEAYWSNFRDNPSSPSLTSSPGSSCW